jgi:hypothetical protein
MHDRGERLDFQARARAESRQVGGREHLAHVERRRQSIEHRDLFAAARPVENQMSAGREPARELREQRLAKALVDEIVRGCDAEHRVERRVGLIIEKIRSDEAGTLARQPLGHAACARDAGGVAIDPNQAPERAAPREFERPRPITATGVENSQSGPRQLVNRGPDRAPLLTRVDVRHPPDALHEPTPRRLDRRCRAANHVCSSSLFGNPSLSPRWPGVQGSSSGEPDHRLSQFAHGLRLFSV